MPAALALSGPFATEPDSWHPATLLETVRAAEQAGLPFVILPDRIAAADGTGAWPDATLLAAWLAASTQTIGFLAATSAVGHQPYNLARRIASLDIISGGRTGWFVRNDDEANERAAFSGATRLPEGNSAERIAEFVSVVRGLWQSWDADALLLDRESGRFLDPSKMHVLNHQGPHFSVQGPLNVMRSPQDLPVLAVDGGTRDAEADLVITPNTFTIRGSDSEPHTLLVVENPAEAARLLASGPNDSPPKQATLRSRLGLIKETRS
ncbi:LLM class flavin-dependent oxidoreductase [Mesorhizobium sp. RP14(2022)]|uniref:LLM class flavin-dependent oxidoreductase n=1 Tax=Mesorhizobium liriopis TaxID=2953882 RepID=A0ABT1C394_9HYPH|nr:LLM class flavin-dependent oxidoreductase [Mesorhizobium liriopis]MCO6048968.1 LLM class flavin-dependent oxidoreductase [Mesorhizobium liriopis]